MLSKKIRKLCKKAGFVFWGNEEWGPGKGHIDWGSEYTNEMDNFVELLYVRVVEAMVDTDCDPAAIVEVSKVFGK